MYIFLIVIWSEFRLGQWRDNGHRKYAPHFNNFVLSSKLTMLFEKISKDRLIQLTQQLKAKKFFKSLKYMGKSLEGIGSKKMEISYNPIGNWNNNIGTYLQREGFIFLSTSCKRIILLDKFQFRWLKQRYWNIKGGIRSFDVQPSKMKLVFD